MVSEVPRSTGTSYAAQQVQRRGAQRDDHNCICSSGTLGPAHGSCKIESYLVTVFHWDEGKDEQ